MAKTQERVLAFVMAAVFLLTSVGITVLVIKQTQDQKEAKEALSQLEQTTGDTEDMQSQNNTQQPEPKEGALQGTKLVGFTPVDKVDTLQIIDLVEGTGEAVKSGATVNAHYTGAVAKDGTIFQSSYDFGNSVSFPLSNVIKGWTDGVPGMKVGGKRRLLIPAAQAYGSAPPAGSGIPADADLVFDIELVKIDQQGS